MKIQLKQIPIREVVEKYRDNAEDGVQGYGGRLDIRPPYQREFVYNEEQRAAVVDTIFKGFPLNVFYWVVKDGGMYEVLDGQQRTVSFAQFHNGEFSVLLNGHRRAFQNLTPDEQERFLDYELMVYFCEGTDSDKLNWFRVINIAGERLTDQELRNAVFSGPWLSSAKSYFSKTGGPAYGLGERFLKGKAIRQEYLETALKWISGGKIDDYMSAHQQDPNANELWAYFRNVIDWVETTFPVYRAEMKGIAWGPLYDAYHKTVLDTDLLESRIAKLMEDSDVTAKRGIYEYVLSGDDKHLNIRSFPATDKREAFERQQGRCANGKRCKTPENSGGRMQFELARLEADHIKPWSRGGRTTSENCQLLCVRCNRDKRDR